jgi:hypothetical protein
MEGWSIADCAYHLNRLDDPKLDIKRSIVSFGNRLDWDLTRMKHRNVPQTALVVQNQAFYTFDNPLSLVNCSSPTDRPTQCRIQCYDDPQVAAGRLLASLFYIELMTLPNFYMGLSWLTSASSAASRLALRWWTWFRISSGDKLSCTTAVPM